MKRILFAVPLLALTAAVPQAMCSLDYAKAVPCRVADRVDASGNHRMTFAIGQRRLTFVGKSQTGWWSGQLDGKPAMGLELNRGHIRFSTTDLGTSLDWWYRGQEHGRY